MWCPGCGTGIFLGAFLRAFEELGLNLKDTVLVSGIGCAGRISAYVRVDAFHTTHGRAIPLATGVKLAKPNLKVTVVSGDGDLFAIGGNHFIHAARRNVDMTVICINNFTYAMTGGQVAPTTPQNAFTTTTPFGNFEYAFNLVRLAAVAGAVYVARCTVTQLKHLNEFVKKALRKDGFSFIEVVSTCPSIYGRYNKLGKPVDMINWLKKNSFIKKNPELAESDIGADGKILCGEFLDAERPTFSNLLKQVNTQVEERLRGEGKLTFVKI